MNELAKLIHNRNAYPWETPEDLMADAVYHIKNKTRPRRGQEGWLEAFKAEVTDETTI